MRPISRTHNQVGRALSFGDSAEAYDRGRPGVPPGIVDTLVPRGDERVLDVGCGTGKASVPIAARGCSVLGVEPDEGMASLARRYGIEVEISTFEEWDPRDRQFDLVVAAQAWHWVDPIQGPIKAAAVLVEGGRLAPVTYYRSLADSAQHERVLSVYRSLEPGLIENSPALGTIDSESEIEFHRDAIIASGRFGEPEIVRERWIDTLDVAGWLDLTRSHSDHKALGAARHEALIDAIETALGDDTEVPVAYNTIAIIAPRID